jgi:translocation and assembly module TamB
LTRVARVAGGLVLALVGVAALLVGGALTLLRTNWGGDLAKRIALPRVNAAIAGRLELGRFSFGGDRVTLDDVVLRAPDGEVVVRVQEVFVAFAPLSLLRGHVVVREARIVTPSVVLRRDGDELNLARAVAPKERRSPAPAPASPSSRRLTLDIADLRVSDGRLEFVSSADTARGARPLEVSAVGITIEGEAHDDAGSFSATVNLGAALRTPLAAPVAMHVTAHGHGDQLDAVLATTLGAAAVDAALSLDGPSHVTARVTRAHVTPELVRAFVPTVPLRVPLDVVANGTRDDATVTFTAKIGSPAGALAAHGTGDVTTLRARDVAISARDVDLGALVEGLPHSSLSLAVTGRGGGRTLRALDGTLSVAVPPGRLEGASVGPFDVRVEATPGRAVLTQLRLVLPGFAVNGRGELGSARSTLHLDIAAADLARASRALAPLRALGVPKMSGSGRVDVSLFGPAATPGVRVTATVPTLVRGDDRLAGATLVATVVDVHAPDRGDLDLHVARARVAGRDLRDVFVHAQSTTRRFAVAARVGGAVPVSVSVAGAWRPGRRAFALDELALRYPRAAWTMAHPALVSLGPERLAISDLELGAREQRVRVSFEKRGARLRGQLALDQLDLGALPLQLVRPGLALAGRVDARVEVGGTTSRPTVQGSVSLRDGAFGHYRDLALRLDGRYGGSRAAGDLAAEGLGTSVNAKFDLPTEWPPRDGAAPLTLDVTVPPVDLARLSALLRQTVDLRLAHAVAGKAGLTLALRGTPNAPELGLDTAATGLVVDGQAFGAISLKVTGTPTTPLRVAVDVRGDDADAAPSAVAPGAPAPLACAGSLELRTDLGLASLLRRPPTARALERARFALSGDLRGIPLGALGRLARSPVVTGGSASLRVSATGTPLVPTGALNVQVVGATGPRFPPTDGRLDTAFGARDVRVALRVLRAQQVLGSASGVLGLPSRQLGDRAVVVAAPLTLRAAVGPLRLQRNDVGGDSLTGLPTTLSTSLTAALTVDGTLARPAMNLNVALADARLEKTPLGDARAQVTYADRRAALDVALASATGGALHVTGQTQVDLGYAQVTRGIDVGPLPLALNVSASHFDLTWLSGLSEDVRTVGGALTAALTASGTIEQPWVSGRVEWTHGALGLTGLGSYRDIHLAAHGDPHAFWLEDLRLASGEGNAHVMASATRTGDRGYDLKSFLTLRRFPVYGQGQALAVLSADGTLTGAASGDGVTASLQLKDAQVELTDAKQKNLQALAVPADVVFMSDGKPADRAEATKLAAATATWAGQPVAKAAPRASAAPAPEETPFGVHLAVDAPRNLWVHGKDVALELGLGPDFRIESAGRPRIYGEVEVRRGRIDVLGRRFDLQAGSVLRFLGPPDAPRLDITAKHVNETENITVILTAKGALDHLVIAVSSPDRPDLTEGQLYTLIVTGHLQLGGNSAGSASASGEAASLVGGLVASQLQKTLAKKLPLDVLTLEAGEGLTGSRLEAGTYLTNKLYAGYVGRVGANPALLQNRNAVHLEYQLSRRWSFDGEYGDVGTGTADLLWTKNY